MAVVVYSDYEKRKMGLVGSPLPMSGGELADGYSCGSPDRHGLLLLSVSMCMFLLTVFTSTLCSSVSSYLRTCPVPAVFVISCVLARGEFV